MGKKLLALAASAALLTGCGQRSYLWTDPLIGIGSDLIGDFLSEAVYGCPPCNGVLRTQGAKGLGLYTLGIPDTDIATAICGFDYYQGHAGGYGDTLELIGCNDQVWMEWSYGKLGTIAVNSGFSGPTEAGVRMGDSLDALIAAYPSAHQVEFSSENQPTVFISGNAKFSLKDGLVNGIEVNSHEYDENAGGVGPYEWW